MDVLIIHLKCTTVTDLRRTWFLSQGLHFYLYIYLLMTYGVRGVELNFSLLVADRSCDRQTNRQTDIIKGHRPAYNVLLWLISSSPTRFLGLHFYLFYLFFYLFTFQFLSWPFLTPFAHLLSTVSEILIFLVYFLGLFSWSGSKQLFSFFPKMVFRYSSSLF